MEPGRGKRLAPEDNTRAGTWRRHMAERNFR